MHENTFPSAMAVAILRGIASAIEEKTSAQGAANPPGNGYLQSGRVDGARRRRTGSHKQHGIETNNGISECAAARILQEAGRPLLTAVKAGVEAALSGRGLDAWGDLEDGCMTLMLRGISPGFMPSERDEERGMMIVEAMIIHPADGTRRMIRLKLPDQCAKPLGISIAETYGVNLTP